MLSQLIQLIIKHPGTALSLALGALQVLNFLGTGVISNLPAPTKDSTAKYIFWFKFLNWCMGNWKRSQIPRIEDSPNWKDAVEAHVQQLSSNGLLAAPPKQP